GRPKADGSCDGDLDQPHESVGSEATGGNRFHSLRTYSFVRAADVRSGSAAAADRRGWGNADGNANSRAPRGGQTEWRDAARRAGRARIRLHNAEESSRRVGARADQRDRACDRDREAADPLNGARVISSSQWPGHAELRLLFYWPSSAAHRKPRHIWSGSRPSRWTRP